MTTGVLRVASAVLVGVGVIGSYLVSHLARARGLERLVLVDPDRFDEGNLGCQEIDAADVGRAKVDVAARRARRIRPELDVVRHRSTVEALPAGVLRADVVLSATDSLGSRLAICDRVWPLGIPWIDAGVHAGAALARVTAYRPGDGRACLECGWDDRHYDANTRVHSCADRARDALVGGQEAAPATGAGSGLGAMAAALLAHAIEEAGRDPGVFGREILIDLGHHNAYATRLRRLAECRRAEHSAWDITALDRRPGEVGVEELLELGSPGPSRGARWIEVLGARFVGEVACFDCGRSRRRLFLEPALGRAARRCPACGGQRVPVAFRRADRLSETDLSRALLAGPVSRLGLRSGDVVTVGREGRERERHFEIG